MQAFPEDIVIGAIDVGAPKNIGWAILDGEEELHGGDLDTFIACFAQRSKGKPAALGFECPLFVPLHGSLPNLTKQRAGEKGRPWSAGAGATVTTIGLAIVSYVLAELRSQQGNAHCASCTLDWTAPLKTNELLLWEAFVSGANHAAPGEHWRDALNAAKGFKAALPDLDAHNAVVGEEVLSLIGACALRTGWLDTPKALEHQCLVIRPDPEL